MVAFIATIPVFTSIAPLWSNLADGMLALLFNDSLLQVFGLTFGMRPFVYGQMRSNLIGISSTKTKRMIVYG
ncbi:hypothetical protein ACTWQL_04525 [Pseudalkalibacillus sp. R45]|uniref:hypothetical protein n=1 Tax=Pseudalkalibacillus sp. R45 TaxID=3457433 RepID=UPI003FCE940F